MGREDQGQKYVLHVLYLVNFEHTKSEISAKPNETWWQPCGNPSQTICNDNIPDVPEGLEQRHAAAARLEAAESRGHKKKAQKKNRNRSVKSVKFLNEKKIGATHVLRGEAWKRSKMHTAN